MWCAFACVLVQILVDVCHSIASSSAVPAGGYMWIYSVLSNTSAPKVFEFLDLWGSFILCLRGIVGFEKSSVPKAGFELIMQPRMDLNF